jgi:acyl-CoA thioesterase II
MEGRNEAFVHHPLEGSTTLEELLALVDLEPLEHNIYRGQNRDIGTGRVFGGQVLAQALVAARRTVDEPREAHSLHGYFILPGDLNAPIVYFVERLRDGGSFTTRRVTAIQHGRAIFNLSASFQGEEEGLSHQLRAPQVPAPEDVEPELDRIRAVADQIPESTRAVLTQDRPIDFRPVDPPDFLAPDPAPPIRRSWFRAQGQIPDDPILHQAVLAYASDYGLLATALQPHGRALRDPELLVASLDHALWFHTRFRVDDWLLYEVDSPRSAGSRGFSRGSVYTLDGTLVASSAQEGLMRVRKPREARP